MSAQPDDLLPVQSERVSPFTPSLRYEYFVGRDEELHRFRVNLGKPNHEFVVGCAGTGKSFYLYKIQQIARDENYLASIVPVDLVESHKQIGTILEALIDTLEVERSAPNTPPRRELRKDWEAGPKSTIFRHCRENALIINNVRHDFLTLGNYISRTSRRGTVICLDEGQRLSTEALLALMNALQGIDAFQIVLSLRIGSDTGGLIEAGRRLLIEREVSMFFATLTGMGSFKSEDEIRQFFNVRLNSNAIHFSDPVMLGIGEITNRVPLDMNQFANTVYNRAVLGGVVEVTLEQLDVAFDSSYPDLMQEAVEFVRDLPKDIKKIMLRLCDFSVPVSIVDLVRCAFPDLPQLVYTALSEGEARRLDDICRKSSILGVVVGEKYYISNSLHRYAVKRALGPTRQSFVDEIG